MDAETGPAKTDDGGKKAENARRAGAAPRGLLSSVATVAPESAGDKVG